MLDVLSLEEQRRIRLERPDDKDVQDLLREIKRIRLKYIGQELNYLSPISERCGRRVKILVNNLNEDAAHLAVKQGVAEQYEELTRWNRTTIDILSKLPTRLMIALNASGYTYISDLLRASETELCELPGVTYKDVMRIETALARIGCRR